VFLHFSEEALEVSEFLTEHSGVLDNQRLELIDGEAEFLNQVLLQEEDSVLLVLCLKQEGGFLPHNKVDLGFEETELVHHDLFPFKCLSLEIELLEFLRKALRPNALEM